MSLELCTAFFLTTSLIIFIPGPTIILVVTQAAKHGTRSVLPLLAGVLLGDFTAMTCSLLGLGAIMAASAALFTVFKWVGAAYLLYLGVKMWREKPADTEEEATPAISRRSLFKSSYVVTALNPKSISFFVAFMPQFVDSSAPLVGQFMILGVIFLFIAAFNVVGYALCAGKLGQKLRQGKVRRVFNRCGGTALIGAGLFTASMERSA